jgi:chemotaxis family two-component system sensor kinase Cph1
MPSSDEVTPPPSDPPACDREPIHVPGSVQPHGVLLVVDEAGRTVLHASANAAALLGTHAAGLVGRPLDVVLGPDAERIRTALPSAPADDCPTLLLTTVPAADGSAFQVLAHRRDGRALLELEPAAPSDLADGPSADRGGGVHALTLAAALRLQAEVTVDGLLAAAAREVRSMTGFDRVMAYRFDPDGHGEVVAEDRAADWGSYLGHHFPASDIPPQARALYLLNRVRLIPDAAYRPAAVVPPEDAETGRPVDLTYAGLRSIAAVHAEYLRNMGVAASLSVSVVVDGRLWGLVACHHRTPRFIPHGRRAACDHFGRVLSAQLAANVALAERDGRLALNRVQSRLLERMAGRADYADGLVECPEDLLELAAAGGAAVRTGDRLHLCGRTPPRDDVWQLLEWLAATGRAEAYATDRLAEAYPPAGAWGDAGAGALAVAFGPARRDGVVWFRPEIVRSVVWAGDPGKPPGPADPEGRLRPRRSFEAWTQVVRRRSAPWGLRHVEAAAEFRAAVAGIVLRTADELAGERARRADAEAANRAKDRHLAFLAHELRGPLTPALLAATAIAGDDGLPVGARADAALIRRNIELTTRLADDLLDANRIALGKLEVRMGPTDAHETVRAAVAMCASDAAGRRVRVDLDLAAAAGWVAGDAARLTQVWCNLLKNAVKFSPPGGRVVVRTANAAGGRLRVEVCDDGEGVDADLLPRMFDLYEQGGRAVTRQHAGLGLGLAICKGIVEAHGGTIAAASDGPGRGTTVTVELPAGPAPTVAAATAPGAPTSAGGVLADDAAAGRVATGRPLRILLVDDHEDTLRIMSRMLGESRHAVTTATGVGTALAAATTAAAAAGDGAFDLLISDVGLDDGSGLDLMRELLKRRPVKGIALTGYGTASDVAATRAAGFAAHLTKPVDFGQLQDTIVEVCP